MSLMTADEWCIDIARDLFLTLQERMRAIEHPPAPIPHLAIGIAATLSSMVLANCITSDPELVERVAEVSVQFHKDFTDHVGRVLQQQTELLRRREDADL